MFSVHFCGFVCLTPLLHDHRKQTVIGNVRLMSLPVKFTILGGEYLGLYPCDLITFRCENKNII